MTVPVWPVTLPKFFTATSYDEGGADNVLRSETSIGPAKTRRRTTANVWGQSGQMVMSYAEYGDFLTFVRDSISDGAKAFTFPDRLGGSDLLVRLKEPHKATLDGNSWVVSFSLEVLP
ncbi:hypothetical protein HJB90_29905 [Rhizobium sp. NLR10a]|uniref:hypothetical protein n=1 Tax=Rhizobium sp. NLR10a TaxID=2731105 RepID=UPI001C83B61C|nr:hypothetical protein [Rhizobium sp. NLR10a]MBX5285186.1 hypothetical protein [Rhizobium sp. NLR10a]